MFCVVGGCVDDDDIISEVVVLHVVECALKCECLVFCDFVLLLWFVVFNVDVVECSLNFVCCSVFVVAVVVEPHSSSAVVVVVVVVVNSLCGR